MPTVGIVNASVIVFAKGAGSPQEQYKTLLLLLPLSHPLKSFQLFRFVLARGSRRER